MWIEPSSPVTGDDLVVRGVEGLPVEWILEGVVMHQGAQLPASRTRKGDHWRAVRSAAPSQPELTASADIVNSVPQVTVAWTPDPPIGGQRPHVQVVTDDADEDPLTVDVLWSTAGSDWAEEPISPRRGELVKARVMVSDGEAAVSVEVDAVAGNSPPVVGEVLMTPDPPTSVDSVTAMVEANDGDGDPLTVEMAWWVDGEPVAGGDTLGPQVRGARIQVVVQASDGEASSREVASGVRVVGNGLPRVSWVRVEPDELVASTSPQCAWEATDPDGDLLEGRVRWDVNGVAVGTGEVWDGGLFVSGDEVSCTLRVTDSEGAEVVQVSEMIVVQDSPPEPPWVRIHPVTPQPGEALLCGVDTAAWDPDGDPITYGAQWFVDGEVFEGGGSTLWTRDTIPAEVTQEGETWRCTMTAEAGALAASGEAEATIREPVGGNILVLLADDLGIDKVGAYASHPEPPRTPVIDQLASQGMLFRNAYAHPICSPTRSAMLTGRYARRTGIGAVIQVEFDAHHVPLEEVLLPEMLTASPWTYESSAVGKWHLAGYASEAGMLHPLEQGFSYYAGSYGNPGATTVPGDRPTDYFYWEKVTNGAPDFTETYMTTDTVNEAIGQIEAMSEPWFLYVAFNAPHDPFHLPPEDLHSYDIDESATPPERYAAMVEALDTEIGRLLNAVGPEVLERTTVVFAGDNGTPEQAIPEPLSRSRSKGTLFEGGVRVPLIVSGPLVAVPGSESDGHVHVVDVFATAAEVAGVSVHIPTTGLERADGAVSLEIDGLSLGPYLRAPGQPSLRRYGYSEKFQENGWGPYDVDVRTIRDSDFKLIRRTSGIEELYDLRAAGLDEGPDVLEGGGQEIQAVADRLGREMDEQVEKMAPLK